MTTPRPRPATVRIEDTPGADVASADDGELALFPAPPPVQYQDPDQHVIQFSGGAGSALAAIAIAERVGPTRMTLLIANTQVEDPDLWRFASDVSALINVPLVIVEDGRDPWQLFRDVGFLGNNLFAPCTKYLKQIPCRNWMTEHAPPETSMVYVGIEPTKKDRPRAPSITRNWSPWRVEFPLLDGPDRPKEDLLAELRAHGLTPPRLYELGFPHNNCGGSCIRAGQRQWRHLLDVFPERFARAEREEQAFRADNHKNVAILKRQRDNVIRPLTLAELRREYEAEKAQANTAAASTKA
ncbi:hypothetical protein [Streptomyces sp. NPDC002215]|uniref:hypothetical protein n=1 Tax=Streptomyces sp. NPDC002215 TaxID=3154412 RepID=UPI003328FB68